MIGAGAGAASAVGSAAASGVGSLVTGILFGGFNPKYSKEHGRKIRYIQQKYAEAYGDSASGNGDPNTIIHNADPNSKLKMTTDGLRPANPFPDERAYEDALMMNFHPTPGHQGKYCASHATVSVGVIIQYQKNRRNRIFVPGVVSAGKPNDYVNMFLEEMKQWLRSQLTLDHVAAEELKKRLAYITKLKNDKYYWCFPPEVVTDAKIHDVIDFVHEKIADAYELTTREERNKSMQELFKDLNNHTINTFEFGKNYLAYLLYISKVAGADLVTSKEFKGKGFQTGRLHLLLVKATDPVLKLYSQDIKMTEQRLELAAERAAIEDHSPGRSQDPRIMPPPSPMIAATNPAGVAQAASDAHPYLVGEGTFDTFKMSEAVYTFPLTDRMGTTWTISRKYSDFEKLHEKIEDVYQNRDGIDTLDFPPKFKNLSFPSTEDQVEMCRKLRLYLREVLDGAVDADTKSKNYIADFISVKNLALGTQTRCRSAENIPNYFVDITEAFTASLTIPNYGTRKGASPDEKEMAEFRTDWGHDGVFLILKAHGYLQRMATILGWTLELNHYFVSMFGNMISFSKLPIREMLLTQKDVMNAFIGVADEIYALACDLNAQNKYKWHKNLHVAEAELTRTRFHLNKSIEAISRIEKEHLDRDVQMRRLLDVAARFSPFMNKVGINLPSIQKELGLPVHAVIEHQQGGDELTFSSEHPSQSGPSIFMLDSSPTGKGDGRFTTGDAKNGDKEGIRESRIIEEIDSDDGVVVHCPLSTGDHSEAKNDGTGADIDRNKTSPVEAGRSSSPEDDIDNPESTACVIS